MTWPKKRRCKTCPKKRRCMLGAKVTQRKLARKIGLPMEQTVFRPRYSPVQKRFENKDTHLFKKGTPLFENKDNNLSWIFIVKRKLGKKRYSPRMPPMMQVKIVANTWRLAEQEGKPSVNCNQCKTPGHQYKTPSVLCNQCETLPSHEISSSVKPNPPSSGLFFSWKVLILQRSYDNWYRECWVWPTKKIEEKKSIFFQYNTWSHLRYGEEKKP